MFLKILPDLLRGGTTTICLLFLFPVLSQPKLKMKKYILIATGAAIFDTFICALLYLNEDYTSVVYYSLFAYLLLVVGCKFLFRDKLLQWCFNCVTVLNVYAIIVMLSFYLVYFFPYPEYAVTVIRIIMFTAAIILFRKYLRPLYLRVSENWAAFLLPITGILINYLYIMLSLGDVKVSMSQNFNHFCVLTLITILTYIAIMISLKDLKHKYLLREENIKRKANEELLFSEISSFKSFVDAAKQNRHDLRHHNAILAEYLNNNDINGAKEYLKLYNDSIVAGALKEFSKDPTTNAVLRLYDRRARDLNIEFRVYSQAETNFSSIQTDIGIILSNIFENALEACKKCAFSPKFINYYSTIENEKVLIEIKNSVSTQLKFENGLPSSTKNGGGTGLLSVKNIVQKYSGMLYLKQEGNEFYIRIVLPIDTIK